MSASRPARRIALGCMAFLVGCAPAGRPLRSLTIVADPAPFVSIEEAASAERRVDWWDANPRDDEACTMSFAAAELARFLPERLGLPPSALHFARALPDTGDALVLTLEFGLPPDRAPLGPQGFRLQSREADGRRVLTVTGGDRVGVLYGAYGLLETLGLTFPGLGDTGIVIDPATAKWPRRLDRTERPDFPVRGFWAFEPRGTLAFFQWMARNRMNQWTAADTAFVPTMKKLGLVLTGGGHRLQADFLPPERDFVHHPEWYGLHAGRRSAELRGESGDNFCTSNAEARRTLATRITQSLIDGPLVHVDWLELWPMDGGRWCECDSCRAQGPPTDRWLDVVTEIADSLKAAHARRALERPVMASTLAYLETLTPPTRRHSTAGELRVTFFPYFRCDAHALGDSTCTELNRRLADAWRGWNAWRAFSSFGPMGMCDYTNVGAFKSLPLIFPHVLARDLRDDHRASLSRYETMHAPTRAWGCWTLNHWLMSRLAWNPEQNPDTLIEHFCRDYFPRSAAAMREHYRALETASANIVALQASVGVYGSSNGAAGRLASPRSPIFPLHHLQLREVHPPTDDGPDLDQIDRAMAEAKAALDRARGLAQEPIERARLADEERRFAYGEAMFALYSGLLTTAARARDGDEGGARESFAAAEAAANALRRVTDLVQVSASHANATDGLEASGVRGTYEQFRKRYGAG